MKRPASWTATGAVTSFLAAGASFFTLSMWDGLAERSSAYLVPLLWLSLVVAALGFLLRSARVSAPLVVLLQGSVVALLLHQHWATGGALGGWLPTPGSSRSVIELMQGAIEETARYSAPITAEATAFPALMVASGAAVVLLVDLLACTLRRVPLAGLPLLAAFTAPVSLLGGVSWLPFAVAAGCFVLLLAADQAGRLGQWGRSLSSPAAADEPHDVQLATVWPTATRIGFAGIGVAVLAPVLMPTTDGLLIGDNGFGPGGGGNKVNIDNPMLDVRRDLRRGEDVELMRVETDDPDPRYLRLSVLDEFTGSAWLPSERDIPSSQRVDGTLPRAPGLDAGTPLTEHRWEISVNDELASKWLPIPYPAVSVDVEGDWRYDDRTLDVMTPVADTTTAGLDYSAVGQSVRASTEALVSAPPPSRRIFVDGTRLPDEVPPGLEELAREVTEGAQSSFERAVMLQQWFRRDGGFVYSVERSEEGNGLEQLERFLGTGEGSRVGYCEQFSAAMALMARSIDLPARVAVGFLRPDRSGSEWVYSTHDLHAWPEIYIQGAGWLRFEPTPAAENVAAPAYTTGRIPAPEEFEAPSSTPSATAPTSGPDKLRPDELPSAAGETSGSLLRWLGWSALVLAGVAALAAPRGVRAVLRRRRLAGHGRGGPAEGAWAEVRATALDLGLGWDDGVTLRRRARALMPILAPTSHGSDSPATQDSSPVEALKTLVLRLERHRFSRTGLPEPAQSELPALAEQVTDAMRRAARPSAQRKAAWLPASLWPRGPHAPRGRAALVADGVGELDRVSL